MARGSAYLCAVMDWHTRCVLGWAVSNTMDTSLRLLALERAKAQAGCVPEIFNTDQGSQFTSAEWTGRLQQWGTAISMDGRRRWMDNVFIERLWRSLKYEDIYLKDYATVAALEQGVDQWMRRYNTWRPQVRFLHSRQHRYARSLPLQNLTCEAKILRNTALKAKTHLPQAMSTIA